MTELAREIFAQILGEKKTEIILFLAQNADKNGFICVKISQICEQTSASKPTVIETIKLLESRKIFERIKNGIYRFKNLKELQKWVNLASLRGRIYFGQIWRALANLPNLNLISQNLFNLIRQNLSQI